MRKIFLILGAVLGILVAAGIFLFLQLNRPTVTEVPVAIIDIPAGTVLKPELFRVARMANLDQQTAAKWVTLADWSLAGNKVATSDIRAGFPIAKTQIDPESSILMETRLSAALTGTNEYYLVVPTGPDEVGNYIQPGDRIDLIINVGGGGGGALTLPPLKEGEQEGEADLSAGTDITQTIPPPVTKLVVQNMTILRIDRDKAQSSSSASSNTQQSQQTTPALGNVKRLYFKVDRDQLEVLSFVLNNGNPRIAVRAANGSQDALPTDGVTWDDFARWFYAQRDNRADGAKPFTPISPYEPPNADQ
ncbi:MAG: hypothetical protein M1546_02035 [Chloroflexi bacterium]|nr:hypothetical protein [Chloroflexota bacterium]